MEGARAPGGGAARAGGRTHRSGARHPAAGPRRLPAAPGAPAAQRRARPGVPGRRARPGAVRRPSSWYGGPRLLADAMMVARPGTIGATGTPAGTAPASRWPAVGPENRADRGRCEQNRHHRREHRQALVLGFAAGPCATVARAPPPDVAGGGCRPDPAPRAGAGSTAAGGGRAAAGATGARHHCRRPRAVPCGAPPGGKGIERFTSCSPAGSLRCGDSGRAGGGRPPAPPATAAAGPPDGKVAGHGAGSLRASDTPRRAPDRSAPTSPSSPPAGSTTGPRSWAPPASSRPHRRGRGGALQDAVTEQLGRWTCWSTTPGWP